MKRYSIFVCEKRGDITRRIVAYHILAETDAEALHTAQDRLACAERAVESLTYEPFQEGA